MLSIVRQRLLPVPRAPARPTRPRPPGSTRRRPRCGRVISAAPSATDDRLANTTSDSMISAAAWAFIREAPYCKATLLARKPRLSAKPTAGPRRLGAGGAGTNPSAMPSKPAPAAISAPPPNIARMRGAAWTPLQLAQQDVGQREAEAARQRQPVRRAFGHRPGRAGGLEHDRHAGHGQRQAQQRDGRGLLAEQGPGQHARSRPASGRTAAPPAPRRRRSPPN